MKLKRLALVFFGVVAGLLFSELGTRVVESNLEKVQLRGASFGQVETIYDPKLGLRIAPNAAGHDANGFRNSSIPGHVDIVALGDSQTWGQNVRINEAWPQKLGQVSGMSIYNMGVNGYGPVEYLALTDQAIKFSPKVIVIGLYFGNDLWDAYHAVYSRETFQSWRSPELSKSLSADVVSEKANHILEETNRLSEGLRSDSTPWLFEWLGHHSAIGRVLSDRGHWPGQTAGAKAAALRKAMERFPDYGVAYDSGDCHTILTTSYRLQAVDPAEVRIREGLRITKRALENIQELATSHQIRLIVLLLPTKELVFADRLKSFGRIDSLYGRLIEAETLDRDELKNYCAAERIEVVDALPALSAAVASDKQIYPESGDGHPNSGGYAVIAETLKAGLSNQ